MAPQRPNYMRKPDPNTQTPECLLVTELSRAAWDAQCYIENAEANDHVTPEVLREFASRMELLSARAFRAAADLEERSDDIHDRNAS